MAHLRRAWSLAIEPTGLLSFQALRLQPAPPPPWLIALRPVAVQAAPRGSAAGAADAAGGSSPVDRAAAAVQTLLRWIFLPVPRLQTVPAAGLKH